MIEIRTLRHGRGEPYVLVHGIGSRAELWAPVIGALARRFEVIAIDLPGFGDSPAQVRRPTVEAQADVLVAWFAEQGLGRPHAGGNSMGAGIALELARRRVVRSATALAPVGFWTPRERTWCQRSLRGARAQLRLLEPVLGPLLRTPAGRAAFGWQLYGRPSAIPAEECLATARSVARATAFDEALDLFDEYTFHDADQLRGIPVTVAWGSRDRLLLARQAARARNVLPFARHEWLQGCGHLPMWDAPDAVARVLIDGVS